MPARKNHIESQKMKHPNKMAEILDKEKHDQAFLVLLLPF